jgi:hypothetical protein
MDQTFHAPTPGALPERFADRYPGWLSMGRSLLVDGEGGEIATGECYGKSTNIPSKND